MADVLGDVEKAGEVDNAGDGDVVLGDAVGDPAVVLRLVVPTELLVERVDED